MFGASLVLRGLASAEQVAFGWKVLQVVGFVTAAAAAHAVRAWLAGKVIWGERVRLRLLDAAAAGFLTMLALAATLIVAAGFIALTDLAVAYLQVGTGILTLGVVLWEGEED